MASRINDVELSTWATRELDGYGAGDHLPNYRASRRMPVHGNWSGPFGMAFSNAQISGLGLPEDFTDTWFSIDFRQAVAELEMASGGDSAPALRWDPWAVIEYNRMSENGEGGAWMEMMSLVDAWLTFPRHVLIGILDAIRTRVLDLALDLERVAPDAGEPGGPTIDDPKVGAVVQHFNIVVNGDGANIATGDHAQQRSTVMKGDTRALVEAARALGLSPEDAERFREAVEADGDVVAENTQTFVERVRNGAVGLVGNTSGSLAATGLIQAASMFFGA